MFPRKAYSFAIETPFLCFQLCSIHAPKTGMIANRLIRSNSDLKLLPLNRLILPMGSEKKFIR